MLDLTPLQAVLLVASALLGTNKPKDLGIELTTDSAIKGLQGDGGVSRALSQERYLPPGGLCRASVALTEKGGCRGPEEYTKSKRASAFTRPLSDFVQDSFNKVSIAERGQTSQGICGRFEEGSRLLQIERSPNGLPQEAM